MKVQVLALAIAAAVALPAAASADRDHYGGYGDRGWRGGGAFDVGYTNGYEEGLEHGRKDAERGRGYGFAHDGKYRRGDYGYRRSYGNRGVYASGFRQGYEAGYDEAYRAFARYGYRDRRSRGYGYRGYGDGRDRYYKDDGRYGRYDDDDIYDWRDDGRHRHRGVSGYCHSRH